VQIKQVKNSIVINSEIRYFPFLLFTVILFILELSRAQMDTTVFANIPLDFNLINFFFISFSFKLLLGKKIHFLMAVCCFAAKTQFKRNKCDFLFYF